MTTTKSEFWVEEPCNLVNSLTFIPTKEMTKSEKLNALSRLAILISAALYFMKCENWYIFLTLSLLIIIMINFSNSSESFECKKDEGESPKSKSLIENFSITPTYTGTDFQQTIIAPTFAEEWQIGAPPAYDIYTQVPYPIESGSYDTFETPLQPQSYPYGQMLSRTNLLPNDEYFSHLGCGGSRQAREYANSAFLRHDLAFRENISRIYKKKLNRRFRMNGGNDVVSPYYSY